MHSSKKQSLLLARAPALGLFLRLLERLLRRLAVHDILVSASVMATTMPLVSALGMMRRALLSECLLLCRCALRLALLDEDQVLAAVVHNLASAGVHAHVDRAELPRDEGPVSPDAG